MSLWFSHDCIHGSTQSGPWVKKKSTKNIVNPNGLIAGRFGVFECSFDKAKLNFLFGNEVS